MRCTGCGFTLVVEDVPKERLCNACGGAVVFDADDFLLRQHGAPGRDVRPGQVQMGRLVEQVIREHSVAFIEAPVGCHGAGQEILMYSGTVKKVEDVVVGDQLIGDDGTPRKVLKLIRGAYGELVTITPVKGSSWTATLDHVLTVVDSVSGRVQDVPLRAWLGWAKYRREESKLFRRAALFAPSEEILPLDPYFLGALLGDGGLAGTRQSLRFTTADSELVETLREQAVKHDMNLVRQSKYGYALTRKPHQMGRGKKSPLKRILYGLGLAAVRCEDRFVPQGYKTGAPSTRLEILAGLLDTDGSLSGGCYDYISKSPRLAGDVVFLARSVGLAAYLTPCQKSAHKDHAGTYYRVCISGDLDRVPCRVPRKKAPRRTQKKDVLRTGFSVSEYCDVKPFYGFTLSENGRYLLGDFTVTHNSGKSDAYGVPAINTVAKDSGYTVKNLKGTLPSKLAEQKTLKPRVVISTAKKNLQHQIAEKDLPFIRKRHGEEGIAIALLKGKSNYACRLKAETSLKPQDKAQFNAWVNSSPNEDLTDFPGKRPSYLFDVTAEDCIGKSCEHAYDVPGVGPRCGFWRAKQTAAKASIIVTNHHVVAYDLRFGPGVIIGPYTTLILDEAHQAPASFRAAFSNVLTQGATTRLLRQIDAAGVGGDLDHALKDAWQGMFGQLESAEGEIPKDPFGEAGRATGQVLAELSVLVAREADNLGWSSLPGWDITKITDKADRTRLMSVLALKKNLERTGQTLSLSRDPGDNTVLYVGTSEKGQKRLTLAPISVGKLVGPKLQMIPSVVITSATMAINGKFDDAKYQLGLNWASYNDEEGAPQVPKVIHELTLGTPFNYDKQAILYTPRHIPPPAGATSPERRAYIAALINEVSRLVRASKGNAFVLFTANQDLQDVHAGLLEDDLPHPIIIQEADAAATLKEFMTTPNSVLLGVKSFWEGVDVQGQKLQLVIIIKLPFPALTDPVMQARSRQLVAEQVKAGVSPQTAKSAVFNRLQIPHMLTELRQGAGRLIRARTDKGVLAILDSRMFTGNSTDRPTPTQTSYRGYGKLAADATGFKNSVFDFEVIQRVFAQWNERYATKAQGTTTPGVAPSTAAKPASDEKKTR